MKKIALLLVVAAFAVSPAVAATKKKAKVIKIMRIGVIKADLLQR